MKEMILNYYKELDDNVDLLSNRSEGELTSVPDWVLSTKRIKIGYVKSSNYIKINVAPDESLNEDTVVEEIISTNEEFSNFNPLWHVEDANINSLPEHSYHWSVGNVKIIEAGNINAVPAFHDKSIMIDITSDLVSDVFSRESARKEAFDIWNNAKNDFPEGESFVDNLQNIFNRFSSIIKRKSFLERRVHRFLNDYSSYLLPSHIDKHFEYPIYLNEHKRVADFILKREETFPSMLIELENPSVKMFKKNGEPTAEANHAKNQIAEWVRFIDQNPENIKGDFNFLAGPKSRLVIMGRGLDNVKEMENSRYSDTIMWTYDFMIKEAKKKCNRDIESQCNLLGIKDPNFIK